MGKEPTSDGNAEGENFISRREAVGGMAVAAALLAVWGAGKYFFDRDSYLSEKGSYPEDEEAVIALWGLVENDNHNHLSEVSPEELDFVVKTTINAYAYMTGSNPSPTLPGRIKVVNELPSGNVVSADFQDMSHSVIRGLGSRMELYVNNTSGAYSREEISRRVPDGYSSSVVARLIKDIGAFYIRDTSPPREINYTGSDPVYNASQGYSMYSLYEREWRFREMNDAAIEAINDAVLDKIFSRTGHLLVTEARKIVNTSVIAALSAESSAESPIELFNRYSSNNGPALSIKTIEERTYAGYEQLNWHIAELVRQGN